MSYRLRVNNQYLDLFPNQEINIGVDYYDTTSVDSIKIPFSFNTSVPYTSKNKIALEYTDANGYNGISLEEFPYEIYKESDLISSGKARVQSVTLNSDEPFFDLEMKDRVSEFSKSIRELKISDIYNDAFSTQVRTLETYLSANTGYGQRDIEIPFVDFDNIQKTTGYESRQFTSWGTSGRKFGLLPALRIVDFIDRVFTATGISYTSKFTSGTGSWDPRNLYMLYPTYLSAEPVSKRESYLFPFPYNVEKNSNQWDGVTSPTIGIANYYIPQKLTWEPFGPTNYAVDEAVVSREYGDQFRWAGGVEDWGDENVGYVSYGASFDASIEFNSGTVSVDGLKACYATSDFIDSNDEYVPTIVRITDLNDAVFTPYVLIYESYTNSSVPAYKIPMLDANGNQLQLTPTAFSDNTGIDIIPVSTGNYDFGTIEFDPFDAKLDPDGIYKINGGSTYSCAIGLDMVSGSLTVTKYKKLLVGGTLTVQAVETDFELKEADVVKKRIFGYDWSVFSIKVDNAGNLSATCPNDNFQFKRSLENNTSISVYDLFLDITKRFGLSLIYDYTSGGIILDNLKDVRLTTASFDKYLDTLKPYEISAGVPPPKTLKLLNKENGGYYDKREDELAIGSYSNTFNVNGVGEQSVEFVSALINPINKTVSLDAYFTDPILLRNGLVSLQEIGDIKNNIPDYDKVGLRIFYLRTPNYQTTLRYPVFRQYNDYGQTIRQIVYKSFGPLLLQGYPVLSGTGNEKDLRFANNDGTINDAYNYLISTERFIANESNKMSFYAAVPDTMFQNGDLYKKKFVFNKTGEYFIVNSLSDAKIYDGYMYGKFEVIFVD